MPRKLTEEGLAWVRTMEAARKAIPTRQQMADKLGVSKSLIDKAVRNSNQVVISRESATKLQECLIELGLGTA